jgi:hypothetical protein
LLSDRAITCKNTPYMTRLNRINPTGLTIVAACGYLRHGMRVDARGKE